MDSVGDEFRGVVEDILSGIIVSRGDLEARKRRLSVDLGLDRFIRNSEILSFATPDEAKKIKHLLAKKPSKTSSGVAVVAAMTAPSKCPHGRCKYCPGGPDEGVPQSYTGFEPATMRAIQYFFDPYLQTTFRLHQLKNIGHPIDKAELIVMGGTLTAQMLDYQEWFVKRCLTAMNEYGKNRTKILDKGEEEFIREYQCTKKSFKYMEDVQKMNESSQIKCVGVTFEPRPDWVKREQIDFMLGFGVTRVELGVQNPDDRVYLEVDRGHTVEDVKKATMQLKDSAFKIGYHMMPGIRGYEPEFDIKAFKTIFEDSDFKPDMIKIYPLIVMEGTDFSRRYRRGEFTPMSCEEAVEVIANAKSIIPKWVRTMRIMRDIPSTKVEAGIKKSNLSQMVEEYMKREKIKCECIRCREVGKGLRAGLEPDEKDILLLREDYDASGGKEIFLSFEDVKNDLLIGFTRLRIPGNPHRKEISKDSALIRELHVYGPMVEVGEKPEYEWQHRGYGTELIREAEKIASQEFDMNKMAIISGVGVRNYYRKLGYNKVGPYMGASI
jgi:elongator complex protein 3